MNRGTLIWAPFPYSNFEEMKARPACVVSAAAYNEGPDLVLAMVTSSARRLERPELGDVVLVDWQEAGLRFPSVLRAGRLWVLERRLIVADHLGQLTGRDLLAVDAALRDTLGL